MRLMKYWQISIFLIIGCSNEDVCEETLDFNKTPIITTRASVEGDENINESNFSVKNPFTPVEISKLEEVMFLTLMNKREKEISFFRSSKKCSCASLVMIVFHI